ncbi:DMT family transporter [Sulfoacidibacillus thermotolerans]|uniref:EamA family transporter n=1 Tax=Sulfoacidibacillus thermotolerans TaxID=1765684 RepID=A0A2U3D6Z5_SULT2|nr:DMT family transporter [Sulfoacidibacillus thermotolerans]PWI57023.1 EamA family transporter [Sulfoacidibacillus thermotolerans]
MNFVNKRHLGALYLAMAASIWGGMYVVSKMELEVIRPLELVWLRYVIAFASLVILGVLSRQSWKIRKSDFLLIASIGIIGYVVSIYAQFLGTKLSSAQMGAVITSATPAFMVLFARLLIGERITWRKALSVALATCGVLLIVGFGDLSRSYQLGGLVLGIAALTWALMSVLIKRVPSDYSQIVVTAYAIFIAVIALTPFVSPQLQQTIALWSHPWILGGLLYLGILSTAVAFFLWNKGLQLVDTASGSLYFFFQPVVGTFLGWVIMGEKVSFSFWIGFALILSGVTLVTRA